MTCPQCAHENPPGAKFCNACGTRLDVACPACGQRNAAGSRFCSECGAPLTTAAAPAPRSYTPAHLAERILTSRAGLEGERKHVTVLFADLKGSMELLAGRDAEEARRLLDPVVERLMQAVHQYEGTVNQVMGDGIMALFGAPLAHEDHALRACYAALRMQAQVGRYGDEVQRSHGVPIQIRVGLNSGDVVVRSIGSDLRMDYTAVGETTHLAARMEQMAKPGSTLVGSATLRLVEGYVQVRSLGPVPVKGLAEPVEVFELLGATAGRTRLQVSAARGLTRFVGRDAELGQLRAALERAATGHGQVAAIVGEAGVGKSRLVWELTHSHRADDWLVLESNSVSQGKATAWAPVLGLLKTYLRIEDRDDARRIRERLIGRLLVLDEGLRPVLPVLETLLDVPGDGGPDAAGRPADERARVVDAVRRLLLRESQAQPLVLVFEDLHWVDPDTQALLDALVESVPSHRILLLVNYRPQYRHEWGGKTYYTQIRLDPLPPETAEALLETLVGADPALAALRAVLVQRAEGNPFFLEEIVRALVETGVLAGERGAYRLAQAVPLVQVPPTVQGILAARIDRLAPADKSLLQCASVVGKDVPLAVLQGVADLPADDLQRGVARLQAAEFLYETRLFPDVEYTFKHALTHEVAYGSLLAERRRALHAQIVEVLERVYPERSAEHRASLVHHAFRGEAWGKALAYLRDAAEVVSPAEIDTVMGADPDNPGRLWWAGQHQRAVTAAERVLAIAASFGNFALRVVASCRLGQAHHALGHYDRAAEVLRQVAASLPGELARQHLGMTALPAVWARSWLAWTLAELGEFAEAEAVAEESIALAAAADHTYSRVQAAFGLGMVHLGRGGADAAIAVLEEAVVVARVAGIPFLTPFLMGPLGAAYTQAGRLDRALPLLDQTLEQVAAVGLAANHALRLAWVGRARLRAGRGEEALALARRAALAADEQGERGHRAHAHLLLGDAAAGGANDGTAAAAYHEALADAEALGMKPVIAHCQLGLGHLAQRAGTPGQARAHLEGAAAVFKDLGMAGPGADAARALQDLGPAP
jgi:class 3 adenylate cyclase/tetratricopeptide (TPR) repeat protein